MSDFTVDPHIQPYAGPTVPQPEYGADQVAARPPVAASSRYTPPQAEAAGTDTMVVVWDGVEVTLPTSVDDWDPDALEAFETGRAISALRGLFGSAGYDKLRLAWKLKNGRAVKVGDLQSLFEAIAVAYGFDTAGG